MVEETVLKHNLNGRYVTEMEILPEENIGSTSVGEE